MAPVNSDSNQIPDLLEKSPRKKNEEDLETAPSPAIRTSGYGFFREYFVTTVVCTTFALFITTYVVHPMTVPTPSMQPTILVGDRLFVDKFTLRNKFNHQIFATPNRSIQRKDIVVFKFPSQPEILYVKRVIGLPGETLEIRNKTVYIDEKGLNEPYKFHSDPYVYPRHIGHHLLNHNLKRDNFGPVYIPNNSYFVMGDNRDDSADSRYFNFLPENHIVGNPMFVFWSYEDQSDAHLKSSLPEILKLYSERIIFFFTRTRWRRMGHIVH